MPSFNWEAVTKEGVRRSGEMEAPDRRAVLQELERQKLLPVRIEAKVSRAKRKVFRRSGKIKAIDKVLLCRHLSVMVRAGIALNPALDILITDAENEAMRQFLKETQRRIRHGEPLWSAFAAYEKAFPGYVIGLIRAGEASGNLSSAFDQAADQLRRGYESRKNAIAAMFYPAILFGMSIFLVLFLFIFAIPRLAETIRDVSTDLPVFSRIVFGVSDFFQENPLLIAITLFLFIGSIVAAFSTRAGRTLAGKLAWRVPFIRSFLKKFAVARFARTLGALLSSGLPAIEALEITASSVGVDRIRIAVLDARERIQKGASFTDAFRSYPEYFPGLLTGMIAVGEQSGQLSELLLTVSKFFEDDAERALKALVGLIEPLMLLMMGGMVGTIAVSVIIPIYQLITVIE